MIIALLGASGSGKSTIERILSDEHDFNKIIPFTTRSIRPGEVNGKDYYFITNSFFDEMLKDEFFAEYEEYSQKRFYGTLKADYTYGEIGNRVVVLTPNGLRQLKRNCPEEEFFSVLVNSSLGTRMKRYIDRCGVNKFNFDDKNEIAARVERDFGAFLGIEQEVDLIVDNNEGTNLAEVVQQILKAAHEKKGARDNGKV